MRIYAAELVNVCKTGLEAAILDAGERGLVRRKRVYCGDVPGIDDGICKMAKQTFRVEGLRELDQALSELPKATSRNVLLRVLKKRGQPIADMGESLAPKGAVGSAQSYTVGTKISRRQRRAHPKESPVEVYVGPGQDPAMLQQEFGNVNHPAQPHLRPAWDATNRGVLDGITKDISDEIEKARARLARKAEREAAKMKSQ